MKNLSTLPADCPLFTGIGPGLLPALLEALAPSRRSYQKGEALLLAGYENADIGIVLSGSIEACKITADGGLLSMAQMGPGGIFGDVMAASGRVKSPVTVFACQDCTVLWLPYERLLAGACIPAGDASLQAAHTQLLRNLIGLMADKYFALDQRVELLMLRSVRAKLLHYLRFQLPPGEDGWRTVPFSRTRLAEYLGCERTALCRELSRMRADGLVQLEGRRLRLLD